MLLNLQNVVPWLITYRYFLIFPITIVEGPVITVMAGFLASLGILNLFIAFWVVVFGDMAGDVIYYSLGRWGRTGAFTRWGKYLGITPARVKKTEKYFKKHSRKTLILGKLTHFLGVAALTAAGFAKFPFGKFFFWDFVATLPKSLALILFGYYFGRTYIKFDRYLSYATVAAIVLAGLVLLIYFFVSKLNRKIATIK